MTTTEEKALAGILAVLGIDKGLELIKQACCARGVNDDEVNNLSEKIYNLHLEADNNEQNLFV